MRGREHCFAARPVGVAQIIDTIVFHLTAYLGLVEFDALPGSIASTLLLKLIIAVLSIPGYIRVRFESRAVH